VSHFVRQKGHCHKNRKYRHQVPSPVKPSEKVVVESHAKAYANYKRSRDAYVFDFSMAPAYVVLLTVGVLTVNVAVVVGAVALLGHNPLLGLSASVVDLGAVVVFR